MQDAKSCVSNVVTIYLPSSGALGQPESARNFLKAVYGDLFYDFMSFLMKVARWPHYSRVMNESALHKFIYNNSVNRTAGVITNTCSAPWFVVAGQPDRLQQKTSLTTISIRIFLH